MTKSASASPVSRRTALAGLGAGGLGLAPAAPVSRAAAQTADMATHPVVGLWQFDAGTPAPVENPDPNWAYEIFHADGTHITWVGLEVGSALGIWRPTGERTAETLGIFRDTDPSMEQGPGTATFQRSVEVDATGNTMSSSGTTIDVRDPMGKLIVAQPFQDQILTRITFDVNPTTGSTVATPTAATPTS
jgi:hypothetical protein